MTSSDIFSMKLLFVTNWCKLLLMCMFFVFSQVILAQEEQKVQYFFPTGELSSEGMLHNGKPDGFWKSYYQNGQLKSAGLRRQFMLDSVWNFYTEDGKLEKSISYRDDKKNGYTDTYDFYFDKDSVKVHFLLSRELFLNGKHEGKSYVYNPAGYLQFCYNYSNNLRDGLSYEFDADSTIISIITYRRGYLLETVQINRRDSLGQRQGRWVEFYPTGAKKTEMQYYNDKPHGINRNYDVSGRMISEQRFVEGQRFVENNDSLLPEVELAKMQQTFYENGQLKTEGAFRNNLPIGIHKVYDQNGQLVLIKEYTEESILVGEGKYDEQGRRTGLWRLYDGYWDYFYSQGNYKRGQKSGQWEYFYSNGSSEMQGWFEDDKPTGEWVWLFPNGSRRRVENYYDGLLDGLYEEYDSVGNLLTKGSYSEGEKHGEWETRIGDIIEYGSYEYGVKTGLWKEYFIESERLRFSGQFRSGDAVGVHKWLYTNGQIEQVGEYKGGLEHKTWYKYNYDGSVYMTRTYRFGKLIKIDNVKVDKGRKK